MGADEPSEDAIAQLARRHGLDALAPGAATIQYLDQTIKHIARSYLTAEPAELTEEVRLYVAWVRRLLNNSRAPAQHHRLYVQLGYLTGIWTSPLGQDTSDERMSSWERSTDSRPNGLVEDSARNSSATRSSWSAAVVDRSLRSLVSLGSTTRPWATGYARTALTVVRPRG